MVSVVGTAAGPTTGGTTVTLLSAALDVTGCQPTLTDGVLDGWTNISSGGGSVVERAADACLVLDTGITAGAVAGVRRTAATDVNFDVDVVAQVVFQQGQDAIALELTLRIDANNDFRVLWTNDLVTVRARLGGVTRLDQQAGAAAGLAALRLVRVVGNVHVLLGGHELAVVPWSTGAGAIELIARNTTARVVTRVSRYVRRPVVLFGGELVRTVVDNMGALGRATVVTPAYPRPDLVDIAVYGCGGTSDTLADGFRYVGPGGLRVGSAFEILNDEALKA